MSHRILLTTINAKFAHAAFGLRYLYAQMGGLQTETEILEFTLSQNPNDMAELILKKNPKIVGMGIYIWNTSLSLAVVQILKKIRPEIQIILGGPEISYETESQPLYAVCDFVIPGEADLLFTQLCQKLLTPQDPVALPKIYRGELPLLSQLQSPYRFYTSDDIQNRTLYVEASRGCPYRCEYCLSSLDKSVRPFDLQEFLSEMQILIDRGARQFKFIDRTFNLSIQQSTEILKFFYSKIELGLFLHFEMVPDRLPPEIREWIQKFPDGSLQFEIGIQTLDPEVSTLISRRQNLEKTKSNFEFLTHSTGVHIHADLIVGLPGDHIGRFEKSFNQLAEMGPHEIQVGLLKRLKGTPIARHESTYQMIYDTLPPFTILQTRDWSFLELQEMKRFAKFWDLYANSGNFKNFMALLKTETTPQGLFQGFLRFTRFLTLRHPHLHSISLIHLVESAWIYLTQELTVPAERARATLVLDYTFPKKREIPGFLKDSPSTFDPKFSDEIKKSFPHKDESLSPLPKRQRQHLFQKV